MYKTQLAVQCTCHGSHSHIYIYIYIYTAKNYLLFWQLHLSPELQLWHGLRDDASLVPCDSHLWAMQPIWSTATIEICPYKISLHATVTVRTFWSL